MKIDRVEQEQWLSNSYLVSDDAGEAGVLVDGNGVMGAMLERADESGIDVAQILLTHAHHDHVVGVEEVRRERGAPIAASVGTAEQLGFEVDRVLVDGEGLEVGGLDVEAVGTPGHAAGHMAFLFDGEECMTGDSLFEGTVAGTMAPGATGFADLRDSIMERLMKLPAGTVIRPGHREKSTVGREWEDNPFIRIWRGLDPEGEDECQVLGSRPARLILWAPDYDGTNKAWVRFEDGTDAIVGGSQVTR